MKAYFRILFILSFLFVLIAETQASEGTNTSGGGFVLRRPGLPPIALDMLEVYPPDYRENCQTPSPDRLTLTPFGERYGFFTPDISQLNSLRLLRERLERWRANSPVAVELVERLLEEFTVRMTNQPIFLPEANNGFALPANARGTPELVAVYKQNIGLMISFNTWNEMCAPSQATLLLHEILRGIQIQSESTVDSKMIQEFTATILWRDPATFGSLDNYYFFNFYAVVFANTLSDMIGYDHEGLRNFHTAVCTDWVNSGHMSRARNTLISDSRLPWTAELTLLVSGYLTRGEQSLREACASQPVFNYHQYRIITSSVFTAMVIPETSCGEGMCSIPASATTASAESLWERALLLGGVPNATPGFWQQHIAGIASDIEFRIDWELLRPVRTNEQRLNNHLMRGRGRQPLPRRLFEEYDHEIMQIREMILR